MAKSGEPKVTLTTRFEEAGAALRRERGQALLEYALVIGFIGMGAIVAMWALGSAIGEAYQAVSEVFETYVPV